jgi:hypothetical protein
MTNRPAQLQNLVAHLDDLTRLLSLDAQCQWSRHFAECLSTAKWLSSAGASQQQLNQLSSSVMSVFGGMGSFNDYAPVRPIGNGKFAVISGMEELTDVSGRVYDSAVALRAIGP